MTLSNKSDPATLQKLRKKVKQEKQATDNQTPSTILTNNKTTNRTNYGSAPSFSNKSDPDALKRLQRRVNEGKAERAKTTTSLSDAKNTPNRTLSGNTQAAADNQLYKDLVAFNKYAVDKKTDIDGTNKNTTLPKAEFMPAPQKSFWEKIVDSVDAFLDENLPSGSNAAKMYDKAKGYTNKGSWTEDQLAQIAVNALNNTDSVDSRNYAMVNEAYERLSTSDKYKDSDLVSALREAKKSWQASPGTALGKNTLAAAAGMGADVASFANSLGADKIPGVGQIMEAAVKGGQAARAEAARYNKGGYGETVGNFTQGVVNLIPYFFLGAGKGATDAALKATKYSKYIAPIVKNPSFWYSLTTMWGGKYQEAIDNGASRQKALANAVTYAVPAALVEVGGGIGSPEMETQKLSRTMLEEIGEELAQDIISGISDKATTNPQLPIYSMEDDAIINPVNMAKTALMTAPIVAVAGGVNRAVNRAAGAYRRNVGNNTEIISDDTQSKVQSNAQSDTQTETKSNVQPMSNISDTNDSLNTLKTKKHTRTKGLTLAENLEEQSKANEPLSVEDVKKATGFGDEGSNLVTRLANREGITFSQAKGAVETAYRLGLTDIKTKKVRFDNSLQKRAFDAGKLDIDVQNRAKLAETKNASVYETGFTENKYSAKLTADEREMFTTVAKDLKMDISFVDKIVAFYVNGKEREANASHLDGKMEVSSTSQKPMVAIATHEGGHRMSQLDPESFNVLMNYLYETSDQNARRLKVGDKGVSVFDQVRSEYGDNNDSMNTRDYVEEIAAIRLETIFSSAEEFNKWRAELDLNPQAKSAWQKFIEVLKKVLEDMWASVTHSKMSLEAKRQAQTELELFENAYRGAIKAAETRANEVQTKNADTNSAKNLEIKINEEYNSNASYSMKWHTDLNQTQLKQVEKWLRQEGNAEETRITDTANWYKGRINGDDLFVIYSNEDANPTILYEVKGKTAKEELNILLDLLEDEGNGKSINGKPSFTQRVSKGSWMQNVNNSQNNLGNMGRGQHNQNAGILQRQSQRNGNRAFWNVLENLFRESEVKSYSFKDSDGNILSEEQSVSNTNPTSNPDIRFSLKQPVEETKDLVAVHNMQVSELERTLDLGGLPMPSIAIIKAQNGHSEYGDVSLVFDKQTIDPKGNKNNKVYGGDAWTPTYPAIEYKPNDKIANKISDKYYELSRKFGYDESRPLYNYVYDLERQLNSNKGEAGMIKELYDDTKLMQLYLLDSGKSKVDTIEKETRTELTDAEVEMNEFFIKELGADVVDEVKWDGNGTPFAYRKNYISKYEDAIRETYKKLLSEVYQFSEEQVQNVLDSTKPADFVKFVRDAYAYRQNGRVTIKTEDDYGATQQAIKNAVGDDYRKWVDSLFKGIEEKSGIRNNADYFTNNGNRRSWETLHWENNLENVVKVMKNQNDVGSGMLFAGNGIWGVAAKDYRSIEEIKADSDRLQQIPEEEYNKIKEGFGQRLSEIAHSIMDKSERNPFIASDNAMECIVDAVRNSKTKSGILNNLKQYQQLTVTETTVDDIISLVNDISNMPTEYFEAKPQRAVDINEIATAIIPNSISKETKERLDNMGIKYIEYEAGNENARLEALNSLEDAKFSLKDGTDVSPKRTTEYLDAVEAVRKGKKGASERLAKYVDSGMIRTEEYEKLIKKYGAINAGERPSRDIQVPKKTAKDKKVSQTVRTILEAKATPDEAVPTIEKMVEDGVFSYDAYTDKQAINDADSYIKEYGWEKSLADWFKSVAKGEVSKELTAMGWALYNNAANIATTTTSETERRTAIITSLKILDAMVRHQRSAAQALQATRILKKLSPETQLYGVQKSVSALQSELTDRYGDKAPDLKIDEELAEQFLNAKTPEERAEIEREIYKDIGRQMPSRFIDKWNAWRYLAMLGNLHTHGRNILGNAFFAPVVIAKDLTATAIESAVNRVSSKKMVRGKALITGNKADRALLKAAWGDYGNVADMISNGGKYNDFAMANQQVEAGRQIFKFKPLEWARKTNSQLLEVEDMRFSKPHYAYAMAQYCKANNITAEQIKRGKAIAPAREYAIKEAQKATYRDTNAFSQMVSEWGRGNKNEKNVAKKAFNAVIEGELPFRKTPANMLVRGTEYSPLGLLKGLSYDLMQVSKGKMTATEAIDNISAGLTGTGLLALGVYLGAQCLIRGHGEDEEDEKKFKEMMGHQAYSLELPNGQSITLDWLAPEALPFFVGVNIWEATRGTDEKVNLSTILKSLSGITEPMLEMSCLQSLNNLFESIGYASSNDTSGLTSILSSAATSYLMQGLPTLFGQIERTGEENRMTTYTEKNDFLTDNMQYTLGKASAKIPFVDYHQIPYIDAWGRKEASGTALKRGFNNFLNPAYTSTIETSDMEEELLRLYEETGEDGVFPERADKYFIVNGVRKDLTAEEYVRYATLKGEKSYKLVSDLVKSKAYKKLSDEEKAKAVRDAYDYANQKAQQAISNYKPDTWVNKADEFGSNVGNYISFKTEVSSMKEDNGGKISKQEVADIILDAAQNDDETWKMYLSMYDSEKDMYAYNEGIEGETYMYFLEALNDVDEPTKSGKYGTYTQKEAYRAIRQLEGLSQKEKAILWQSVNTSWKASNNPFR